MPRLPKAPELLLVLGSLLVAFLAMELGLRLRLHLQNRGLLEPALSRGVDVPADGRAELGHMIRRSRDAGVVYELKPDLSVIYQGARVHTNADGFRSPPEKAAPSRPPADTSPNTLSIVGLGDSFMFGQGVEDDETYLAIVREQLDRDHPETDVRVINTAVPGYNTAMEVATLKAKGLSYAPDVVIIEFVGNDLSLPNFVQEPQRPWSLRRSLLNDFVRERLGAQRDTSLWRRLLAAGLRGVPQDELEGMGNATDPSLVPPAFRNLVGWDAFGGSLRELLLLSEGHGFVVVAISLDPADSPFETRALALSRELGFDVIDIGAKFRDYLDQHGLADYLGSPLALSPDDGHPSVLAHRIAGEALADALEERLLEATPTLRR